MGSKLFLVFWTKFKYIPFEPSDNQSVKNAGVAFVKGANERNEFFENIDEQVRTNTAKD